MLLTVKFFKVVQSGASFQRRKVFHAECLAPLYCTALHCSILSCTALHCTELHCTALYCTAIDCIAVQWRVVPVAAYLQCSVLPPGTGNIGS